PYSVDEVVDFYEGCGFDFGISVDHVILGYDSGESSPTIPAWAERQKLTLDLASDFLKVHRSRHCLFEPLGVAQGWSPHSYASAVSQLQSIGYRYIALGGMVGLKSVQITDCLRAIGDVRRPEVQLHLLGISRCDQMPAFKGMG